MPHCARQVENLDALVATLTQKGHNLIGELQTYQNLWRLCYIRGPENIIIELAERL